MARSFILGGVAGTNLATGKPYIKRIVRTNGAGGASVTRADGLTCVHHDDRKPRRSVYQR